MYEYPPFFLRDSAWRITIPVVCST